MSLFYIGSRSAVVNMEVRGKAASMLNRKCVVLWWAELTLSHFLDLIHRGAGALVLLLPPELPKEGELTEVGGWVGVVMECSAAI